MKLIHELHTNASASETINQREFDRIRDDLTEQALADADQNHTIKGLKSDMSSAESNISTLDSDLSEAQSKQKEFNTSLADLKSSFSM